MPRRWISETICDSPNFNQLSNEAEIHFYRCLTCTDDYGCFKSQPAILKGHCYPLKEVGLKDIQLRHKELEDKGIIISWQEDGRDYSVFTSFPHWNYTKRRHSRKTPIPPQEVIFELCSLHPLYWLSSGDPVPRKERKESDEPRAQPKPAVKAPDLPLDPVLAAMAQCYEDNVGVLTPIIHASIIEARDEYPSGWFEKAVAEAVAYNKRNIRYIMAILKRWQVEGIGNNGTKAKSKPVAKVLTAEEQELIDLDGFINIAADDYVEDEESSLSNSNNPEAKRLAKILAAKEAREAKEAKEQDLSF
uniref:Putative DnaB domain protein n=1 Tax=viral metagenome TaxID=1070528 RepID=A0A6M3KK37_9ZZZZ